MQPASSNPLPAVLLRARDGLILRELKVNEDALYRTLRLLASQGVILANCRKAIPDDGVLRLVEWDLFGENVPSNGKFIDIVMLILTGGRERSIDEYRELLASAGFRLNRVVPTAAQFAVIEAFPV